MKTCTRCSLSLPLDQYCVNRALKSGLNSSCKDCQKKAREKFDFAGWYQQNKESANRRNKAYRKSHPEIDRKYRERTADRQQAYGAVWRAANPERVAELKLEWKQRNPERRLQLNRESRQRHGDVHCATQARRRFAKAKATPKWANEFFIAEAYHLAKIRTQVTGQPWEVDHLVPLTNKLVCGLHVEHNLAVIPAPSNRRKSNRYWPDMP